MGIEQRHARGGLRALGTVLLVVVVTIALASPAALAQESDSKIEIHGFGGWAFGDTDGNRYLVGDEDGEYDNADFALNLTAKPYPNLTLVMQIQTKLDSFQGAGSVDEDVEVDLDYAFAEWFVSDAARFRIGRVKHPYGLYADVFDVGTIRPFYFLPQSIYGPQGFTGEAYNGVGITGTRYPGDRWGLQYDVYLGQIQGEINVPGILSDDDDLTLATLVENDFEVNEVLGGRLNVLTPVEGLMVGLSGYFGDETIEGAASLGPGEERNREVYGAHAEYLGARLWLRGEYGHLLNEDQFEQDGYYLEAAWKLTESWQLATRYDWWEVDPLEFDRNLLERFTRAALEHEELALGVNYWFNPSFVIKLSYHQVEGIRFAYPQDPEEILEMILTDTPRDETDLLVFGAQFSF